MALTPKQQRFVDEYLIDLNATQAAIRAGYSPKSADKIGPKLVGKSSISEAIAAARALLGVLGIALAGLGLVPMAFDAPGVETTRVFAAVVKAAVCATSICRLAVFAV